MHGNAVVNRRNRTGWKCTQVGIPSVFWQPMPKKEHQKKGKHVTVFVQPFILSSSAQGLPELKVASLHLIALLFFSSIFFCFPSPCSGLKKFLSLNTCWVKKCRILRWAFKNFYVFTIEDCCRHRTKYIPQDLVHEMLLCSENSPCLPQNDV